VELGLVLAFSPSVFTFYRLPGFDHPANGIVLNEVAVIRRSQAFIYFLRKPLFVTEEAVNRFLDERLGRAALRRSHA
jgi:hypothetical protein